MVTLDCYRGRRALVTGHTGFKGSWLAVWLQRLGADVAGFALPPASHEEHFGRLGLAEKMHHIEGDLRAAEPIARAIAETQPEIIFHLAAQPLVRRSYAEPKLTFDTNVTGAVHLLEAVRATPSVRALVFVTSDKCYRNLEWPWGYRETDELGGGDPYSASKACAELVLRCYGESWFSRREKFAAASARAGNVIGGGDFAADRIVPDCIRALAAGEPIRVRNPEATRPWQHVLEPLGGYLTLGAALLAAAESATPAECHARFSGGWNFGPTKASNRTVGELVGRVIARWGSGAMKIEREAAAPHESRLLHLNCDRAQSDLGWAPTWHFAESVDEATRWYRRVLVDGEDAWTLTTEQIAAYEKARDAR